MEHEASPFEASEMMATLLASTPLLSESWRVSCVASYNKTVTTSNFNYVMEQIGSSVYVGFSSTAPAMEMEISTFDVNPLDLNHYKHLFSPLLRQINEGEQPILVHSAFFDLFLSIYGSPDFQNQMVGMMENSKSIVITGHSVGGTIASLTTLWLLSYLQSRYSPIPVLCVTFGSPLLGNESLSRAILRERWDGNFCHVVSKHDIMPRLLFAPSSHHIVYLQSLLKLWHSSSIIDGDEAKAKAAKILQFVTASSDGGSLFWPFGSYLFCSENGAICMDNPASVIKMMMHLMLVTTASASSCVEDHLKYGDNIGKLSLQFLKHRNFAIRHGEYIFSDTSSCYEAGIALALQSLGITTQEAVAEAAKDCLKMARRMGRTPNLNVANLAIKLSKITPYRAEIEWYKACCDDSEDQKGYYDSFKLRGTSKKDSKVNMNRIKLGSFWDTVIDMLENNQLPHDFHRRAKWVNASQFYKLLVEPLDIADYYRQEMHHKKGHYLKNGRERRYKIFDRWWKERRVTQEENDNRSRLASLTQDSCFWAKLEEAKDCLENIKRDEVDIKLLWQHIQNFEMYALELIESKQVSKDVLAKNSSYTLWVEELRQVRSQLLQFQGQESLICMSEFPEEDIDPRLRRILEVTSSHRTHQNKTTFTTGIPPNPLSDIHISTTPQDQRTMAARDPTLKELASPVLNQQPLCIQYPHTANAFELKSGMIHLLPTFHGFAGEDPNKHLKEFHVVCSSMKPTGISEEEVKLRAFPFFLADNAKDQLYAIWIHRDLERDEEAFP